MSNDLSVAGSLGLSKFDPVKTLVRDAKADALIEYAGRVADWPLLEETIDAKLDEVENFVSWWRATVTPNRKRQSENAVRRLQTVRADAEQSTGISQQTVSKWGKYLKVRDAWRAAIAEAAYKKFKGDPHYRAEGSGENEWYTPREIIEAARATMGSIDLDPASCNEAQTTVKAGAFFTVKDDGLVRDWFGNVWLNPPYSRDLISRFSQKLTAEIAAGRVRQAVLLTHNNTDTEWFHNLAPAVSMFCFRRGRVAFFRGDTFAAAANGQMLLYFGPNVVAFTANFGNTGLLLLRA